MRYLTPSSARAILWAAASLGLWIALLIIAPGALIPESIAGSLAIGGGIETVPHPSGDIRRDSVNIIDLAVDGNVCAFKQGFGFFRIEMNHVHAECLGPWHNDGEALPVIRAGIDPFLLLGLSKSKRCLSDGSHRPVSEYSCRRCASVLGLEHKPRIGEVETIIADVSWDKDRMRRVNKGDPILFIGAHSQVALPDRPGASNNDEKADNILALGEPKYLLKFERPWWAAWSGVLCVACASVLFFWGCDRRFVRRISMLLWLAICFALIHLGLGLLYGFSFY